MRAAICGHLVPDEHDDDAGCDDCEGELADALALEAERHRYADARCVACGVAWVDILAGEDTCRECRRA